MRRILAMAVALTLAWSGSSAQDALTDDEQFASYCWGVTVQRTTVAKTFASRECPEADADCRQFRTRAAAQAAEDEAAHKRLGGYLERRGLSSPGKSSQWKDGVEQARKAGGDDVSLCGPGGVSLPAGTRTAACDRLTKCSDTSRFSN
jgi:hypothetical protein